MKQQKIYEVAIIPIGSLNTIRPKATVFTYFSNLKRCIETLSTSLAVNNWENNINYTAVYRSLKEKGKYNIEFEFANNKIYKITISPRLINPSLSLLGIDERPS